MISLAVLTFVMITFDNGFNLYQQHSYGYSTIFRSRYDSIPLEKKVSETFYNMFYLDIFAIFRLFADKTRSRVILAIILVSSGSNIFARINYAQIKEKPNTFATTVCYCYCCFCYVKQFLVFPSCTFCIDLCVARTLFCFAVVFFDFRIRTKTLSPR